MSLRQLHPRSQELLLEGKWILINNISPYNHPRGRILIDPFSLYISQISTSRSSYQKKSDQRTLASTFIRKIFHYPSVLIYPVNPSATNRSHNWKKEILPRTSAEKCSTRPRSKIWCSKTGKRREIRVPFSVQAPAFGLSPSLPSLLLLSSPCNPD